MSTRPAIGETVHYVGLNDDRCKAAIVTRYGIRDGEWPTLDLTVFTTIACTPEREVPFGGGLTPAAGTWHWKCGRS